MTMLDLSKVHVSELCSALEDNSYETSWYLDPKTGEVVMHMDPSLSGLEEDEDFDADERGLVYIDPIGSHEAYRDLEDFSAMVRDPRARDLLERAIQGRGAFRRFKDTLFEFPDLRQAWFAFHDARMQCRAVQWLAGTGLIDEETATKAIDEIPEPDLPELSGPFDPVAVAEAVAADLKGLYGDRLKQVILFGSWARGEGDPEESDIDLMVVLDRVESVWDEHDRWDEVMWRHSFENATVVTGVPVGEQELVDPSEPVVINALREGRRVA